LVFGADNVDLQVVPRSREPGVLVSYIPIKVELIRLPLDISGVIVALSEDARM
jgi:hypothetical protein